MAFGSILREIIAAYRDYSLRWHINTPLDAILSHFNSEPIECILLWIQSAIWPIRGQLINSWIFFYAARYWIQSHWKRIIVIIFWVRRFFQSIEFHRGHFSSLFHIRSNKARHKVHQFIISPNYNEVSQMHVSQQKKANKRIHRVNAIKITFHVFNMIHFGGEEKVFP